MPFWMLELAQKMIDSTTADTGNLPGNVWEHPQKGATWVCGHCHSTQWQKDLNCTQCGAPKVEKPDGR